MNAEGILFAIRTLWRCCKCCIVRGGNVCGPEGQFVRFPALVLRLCLNTDVVRAYREMCGSVTDCQKKSRCDFLLEINCSKHAEDSTC